jgi:hypothetical protein
MQAAARLPDVAAKSIMQASLQEEALTPRKCPSPEPRITVSFIYFFFNLQQLDARLLTGMY